MSLASAPVLGQQGMVLGQQEVVLEASRMSQLSGWWMAASLVIALAVMVVLCVRFYARDTEALPRATAWALIWLRLCAIAGLVVFLLDCNRRIQQTVVRPSEAVVIVDTSQSMTLPATLEPGSDSRMDISRALLGISEASQSENSESFSQPGDANEGGQTGTRAPDLKSDGLIAKLAEAHRTSVYTIDGQNAATLLAVRESNSPETTADDRGSDDVDSDWSASLSAWMGVAFVIAAIGCGLISMVIGQTARVSSANRTDVDDQGLSANRSSSEVRVRHPSAAWILATALLLPIGIGMLGVAYVWHTDRTLVGLLMPGWSISEMPSQSESLEAESVEDVEGASTDWNTELTAAAVTSRLGDAVAEVLGEHDASTLAGIVVITDGQINDGRSLSAASRLAARGEVALYPVGLGSDRSPTNVRVVDLEVPRRVYPGDKFAIATVIQASGAEQMTFDIEIWDGLDDAPETGGRSGDDPDAAPTGQLIETKTVTIAGDGSLQTLRFDLAPREVARRKLAIRVVGVDGDQNRRDDSRVARYEVVSRRLKVLAVAGGPTREYRFVRNLLFRDESVELDVWLQTGRPGMSQDANGVLESFPKTAESLFDYDAILWFDPDWSALRLSELELVDQYVSRQAGGMLIVAGPVYHNEWIGRRTDPRTAILAGFYPVNFSGGSPVVTGGRTGGEQPWPLDLTDDAARSDFLWIAETGPSSVAAWQRFGGVHDFVATRGPKAAANIYAYYSDPTTHISGNKPIFLASQFYGSGRVFFAASGEMWRLRGVDESYFDTYYTKLVRWLTEGRLLRDSNRGVLLVDKQRAMVGDSIAVRAVLVDDQFRPLVAPEVTADLLLPSGQTEKLNLAASDQDASAGTFVARFTVRESGDYEILLPVSDDLDADVLSASVNVRLPMVELERPRRAGEELRSAAEATGGTYIPLDRDPMDAASQLTRLIQPQPQMSLLAGAPDATFSLRRNAALLWLIATVMTMEWITRRLNRLA